MKRFFLGNISRTLHGIAVVSLLLCLSAMSAFYLAHKSMEQSVLTERLREIERSVGFGIENEVASARRSLATLASLLEERVPPAEDATKLFAKLLPAHPHLSNLLLTDAAGIVVTSVRGSLAGADISRVSGVPEAMRSGRFTVSEPVRDMGTNRPSFYCIYPILNNGLQGLLIAALDIEEILPGRGLLARFPQAAVILTDEKGTIISCKTDKGSCPTASALNPQEQQSISAAPHGQTVVETRKSNGENNFLIFSKILLPDNGQWHLSSILSIAKSDLTPTAGSFSAIAANLSPGLVLMTICAAIWRFALWALQRPAKELLAAMEKFENGDLNARSAMGQLSGEIGRIAKHFNFLAGRIAHRQNNTLPDMPMPEPLSLAKNHPSHIYFSEPAPQTGKGSITAPDAPDRAHTEKDAALPRERQTNGSRRPGAEKRQPGPLPLPPLPGLDMDGAIDRLAGNTRLYVKTLCMLPALAPMHEKSLDAALARNDVDGLYRAVHTIQGLAATIGAHTLHKEALALGALLHTHDPDPAALNAGVERLKTAFIVLADMIAKASICPGQAYAFAGGNQAAQGESSSQEDDLLQVLEVVVILLTDHNAAAPLFFARHRARLEDWIAPGVLKEIEAHMKNFEYDAALQAIKELQATMFGRGNASPSPLGAASQ